MKALVENLRKELNPIYEQYLNDPKNSDLRKKARNLYNKFVTAAPLLDKDTEKALITLVDVGYDTGIQPPSKKAVRQLLKKLK